ncbi:MAG TPA: ABC transporter permease [Candidatus Pacearchaeota archaeon]|nr:ABC transporter permease [Candidatus Pacearchaeota archaeon]
MLSLFNFSFRNAFRKKGVAILAILGVALGCSLMTFLLSLSQGMNQRVEKTFTEVAGTIVVGSEGSILGGQITTTKTPLPADYVERIEKLNYVDSVSPRVNALIPPTAIKTPSPIGLPITGIDPAKEKDGPLAHIIEGRSFQNDNEIIVGKSIKQDLEFFETKLSVGDKITIPQVDPKTGQLLGQTELIIVGTFETGNITDDAGIFGSIDLARKLSQLPEDKINTIIVKADSINNIDFLSKEIEEEFKNADPGVRLLVSKDLLGEAEKTLDILNNFLFAIAVVSAIAGGVSILIVMLISVIERRKEFGIFKAVGWKGSNVVFSVLIESLTLSIIGALVGIGVGYGGICVARKMIIEDIGVITPQLFIGVVLFGVLLGILGGIYPAWRASRVAPMEILREP